MAVGDEQKPKTITQVTTNGRIYQNGNDEDDDANEETTKLLSEEKSPKSESISPHEGYPVVAYKQRWLMLLILSLNMAMTSCLFVALSSINNITRKYYSVPATSIEWLSNMCLFAYVVFSLPMTYMISGWGIRPVICASTTSNLLATLFHFIGYKRDCFYLVVIGQVFTSLSLSAIFQMSAKVSSLWFPNYERATATAISVLMGLVGNAIGFVQPTMMVRSSSGEIESDLKLFYLSQLLMSAVIVVPTCFYKEKPPTPPCSVSHREALTLLESINLLWRNKYFVFLSQSYSIYFGLFCTIFVLQNPLVTVKFPAGKEGSIGWMGFWNIMVAIGSLLFLGRLLDRFHKYQLTAVFLNIMSMLMWVIFVLALNYMNNFTATYIIYVVLGIFFLPYIGVGLEQAAEMTYPVSEEISSCVVQLGGSLYGFIFIFVFGLLAERGYNQVIEYVIAGLYLISTLTGLVAKTDLNRLASEEKSTP